MPAASRARPPPKDVLATCRISSGKPLFNAPEWNFNVNAQYDFALGETLGGFANIGYRWQDDVIFNLLQDPDSVQEAYGIANISGGIKTERSEADRLRQQRSR